MMPTTDECNNTHLLERLKSQIPLLVIRLNDLENRRQEQFSVSDRNVSSSESSRTSNVLGACAELFDNLLEGGGVR